MYGVDFYHIELINNVFERNTAVFGGAVGLNSGMNEVFMVRCAFLNNTVSRSGAAILVQYDVSYMLVADCIFSHNTAREYGGGVHIVSGNTQFNVWRTVFENNLCEDGGMDGLCVSAY